MEPTPDSNVHLQEKPSGIEAVIAVFAKGAVVGTFLMWCVGTIAEKMMATNPSDAPPLEACSAVVAAIVVAGLGSLILYAAMKVRVWQLGEARQIAKSKTAFLIGGIYAIVAIAMGTLPVERVAIVLELGALLTIPIIAANVLVRKRA